MIMDEKALFKYQLSYSFFIRVSGKLYCRRLMPFELAFQYEDGDWKEVGFKSIPEEGEKVDEDAVYDEFNGPLLLKRIQETEERICAEEDKRVIELAKNTKRKIIGWAFYPYGGKLLINKEKSDEVYAAVVKDVLTHGYFFSGEAFQNLDMFPILEDYTYVDFSRRGFGALMALTHGDHGPFAYARYSDEVEPWEDAVTPEAGLYPEYGLANEDPIEIDGELFDDIFEKAEQAKELQEPLYLIPAPFPESGKFYFPNEAVYLKSKRDGRVEWFMLRLIQIHGPNEPLNQGIEEGSFDCLFPKENPLKGERHIVLGIDLCII